MLGRDFFSPSRRTHPEQKSSGMCSIGLGYIYRFRLAVAISLLSRYLFIFPRSQHFWKRGSLEIGRWSIVLATIPRIDIGLARLVAGNRGQT